MTMTEQQQRAVIEQYIRGYNIFDVAVMTANLHDDIVFINKEGNNVTQETTGIEEFRKVALETRQYFSSREQKIKNWNFNENTVTIDVDFQGLLASDHRTLNSGDGLLLEGKSVFTFKDGKIARIEDAV